MDMKLKEYLKLWLYIFLISAVFFSMLVLLKQIFIKTYSLIYLSIMPPTAILASYFIFSEIDWINSFRPNKRKSIILAIIAVIIIISAVVSQNVLYCIEGPCTSDSLTALSYSAYRILSYSFLYSKTNPPISSIFPSLIISLVANYAAFSMLEGIYGKFSGKGAVSKISKKRKLY